MFCEEMTGKLTFHSQKSEFAVCRGCVCPLHHCVSTVNYTVHSELMHTYA